MSDREAPNWPVETRDDPDDLVEAEAAEARGDEHDRPDDCLGSEHGVSPDDGSETESHDDLMARLQRTGRDEDADARGAGASCREVTTPLVKENCNGC